ncbi:hypothetical protein [Coralloluteibacterium stylophorae]|uniref:DUF2238 domain-containing protein n=1 Tax=Coralloluteibacterium stylophorae TaxID=1776034 RepID=A0A8J8AZE5_9GAMM|nr:hypothetical protein [Coralloluteibacterium stylophorae]MBS7458267.1 hypothetical protein [Coralloluteibacterium stylophorae]
MPAPPATIRAALAGQHPVTWLVQLFYLVAIPVQLALGQPWEAFAAFASLGLVLIPLSVRCNSRLAVPRWTEIGTALFVFATTFLGERLDFYERLPWWDAAAHAASAAAVAAMAAMVMRHRATAVGARLTPGMLAAVAFTTAVCMGSLWEILEFAFDTFFDANTQKDGHLDTMGDIIANTLGAAVGAWLVRRGTA